MQDEAELLQNPRHSAAKIQKWIGVRFERGLSASRRILQLGSPLGRVRPI